MTQISSSASEAASLPPEVLLTDPVSGLIEAIGYFEGPSAPLYRVLHRAAEPSSVGVVIAQPFLMETQRNYRREVLAAKALAAAGFPTLRFSYRGEGHSGGEPETLGFDGCVGDTVAAVEFLRSTTRVSTVVIIGTRLGAIVGAAAAAEAAVTTLIGWDPLVTGVAWVKELSRAAKVQAMRDEEADVSSIADQLTDRGETEVLGSSLFPLLHDSVADVQLVDAFGTNGDMLLIQFGKPERIKKATTTAATELEAGGVRVTVTGIEEEESWWATRRADYFQSETDRILTKQLISKTVAFIEELAR